MSEQEKELYRITALTNLHVGSGDQNYGIVDKLVQRDPLSQFPVIHASSLKGALKKYCESIDGFAAPDILSSFGGDEHQGNDKYFSAHLLTIPVRSNVKPYFRATCPAILKELLELLKSFEFNSGSNFYKAVEILAGHDLKSNEFGVFGTWKTENCIIEEYSLIASKILKDTNELFKKEELAKWIYKAEEFIIVADNIFMEICENLPVVARNRLGEHNNLWYEELVPRQSEFCFFYVGAIKNRDNIMKKIEDNSKKVMPVQIGANASVGYGYCKIDKISKS
jgi:CRISPR-associated protein Cmr4